MKSLAEGLEAISCYHRRPRKFENPTEADGLFRDSGHRS